MDEIEEHRSCNRSTATETYPRTTASLLTGCLGFATTTRYKRDGGPRRSANSTRCRPGLAEPQQMAGFLRMRDAIHFDCKGLG